MLIVKDSPDDAENMLLALRRGGIEPAWDRVETVDGLRAALAAGRYDAVLSDYTLPEFGAPAALEVVRAADQDVPFIVVSGAVGEDAAVAMMRATASDYVLKHNLIRLAPTVEREVREAGVRRARRATDRAAAHLAAVVESSDDAIVSKTLDGVITTWNSAAERLYGWSAIAAIGRDVSFLVPRDKVDELAGIMVRLRAGERIGYFETVRMHRDGSRIDVSMTISPIRGADGRLVGVSKTARDIRKQKTAEVALRHSEARYRGLIESIPALVWVSDAAGRRLLHNRRWDEYTGQAPDDGSGDRWHEIIHPDDAAGAVAAWERSKSSGEPYAFEYRLRRADGAYRWFLSKKTALRGLAGIEQWIGVCTDIDDRKRAEEELRRSADLLAAVAEGTTDSVYVKDREGKYLLCNPAAARFVGRPVAEVLGKDDTALFGRADARLVMDGDRRVLDSGENETQEDELTNAGMTRTFHSTKGPYRDAAGNVIGIIGISRDISERKRAEDSLQASGKRFRELMDQSSDRHWSARRQSGARGAVTIVTAYGLMLAAVALVVLARWALDPFLGEHDPLILFIFPVILSAWFAGWKPASVALVLGYLIGDHLFIEPHRSFGFRDIEHIIGGSFFVVVSIVGIILSGQVGAAMQRATSLAHLLQAEVAAREQTQEQLRGAKVQLEQRVEQRTAQLSRTTDQLHDEEAGRRAAEAKVHRLAAIVSSSDDAIVGIDLDGTITDWNAGAESLFAFTAKEAIGQPSSMLVPPAGRDEMVQITERLQRGEDVRPFETVRLRKDGSEVLVSLRASTIKEDGRVVGQSAINRDLTHTKQLEEQFRQAQKMEAIGQLAGGVAHDFNNLLTVISGYSELMLGSLRRDDSNRPLVQEIYDAGERAALLTRQLLAFSRKEVVAPRLLNLNATVTAAEKFLRRLIGEDVILTATLAPDLDLVTVDPGQIEQVILNLAVNSRDAMPQGGRLTIETAVVDLDDTYAAPHLALRPGRYVRLAVSDTGIGMTADIRQHAFEPFFTTKAVGRGTGLGLATVYGIVRQAAGQVDVSSEPGVGTTFKVYLPSAGRADLPTRPSGMPSPVKSGTETVMLVEDDDMVRAMTRTALELYGYTVLEARCGNDALALSATQGGTIDLLVTDVVMPGMNGRQVAAGVAERWPAVKVLYCSGYTDDAVMRHGVLQANVAFLQKPFTAATLAVKVREVLDATAKPIIGQNGK